MPRGRAFHKPLRATPTEYDGVMYHSKAEAERAAVLDGLMSARLVHAWFRQVKADVEEPGIRNPRPYLLDFLVAWNRPDGNLDLVAEEVKGADSPSFRRHVKQWELRGRLPLRVVRNGKVAETIPGGSPSPTSPLDGCRFNGYPHRNQAVAKRASVLASHYGSEPGDVVAFWREVDGADFLVATRRKGGGVNIHGELIVRSAGESDGLALRASWISRGVLLNLHEATRKTRP